MTGLEKTSARLAGTGREDGAEEWIPAGLTVGSGAPPPVTERVPAMEPATEPPGPDEPSPEPAEPPPAAPTDDSQAELERLRGELREAERRARAAEARAMHAERELRRYQAAEQADAGRPATAPRSAAGGGDAGGAGVPLDLNAVTFESLRSLGLSVNQSARLIAYRDQRGGFASLDDVDRVTGIPAEIKADLKQRGAV